MRTTTPLLLACLLASACGGPLEPGADGDPALDSVESAVELTNGAPAWQPNVNGTMVLNPSGRVGLGTTTPRTRLHLEGGSDAALADGTGYLLVGNQDGTNMVIDDNEIMARSNGAAAALYLNDSGGDVLVHRLAAEPILMAANGDVGVGTTNPRHYNSTTLGIGPGVVMSVTGTIKSQEVRTGILRAHRLVLGSDLDEARAPDSHEDAAFAVRGKIAVNEIVVTEDGWPDFVFEKGHVRPSLPELAKQIDARGHLPGMPSAAEVAERGVNLGEMNKQLLQKVEELTLYVIEEHAERARLEKRLAALEGRGGVR